MKPSIANIRKMAKGVTDIRRLQILKDDVVFYIAGLKEGARNPKKYGDLYDEAISAIEFIKDQIS